MWMRVAGAIVGGVALLAGGGFGWLSLRQPAQVAPRTLQVSMAPDRVARGRYLFETLCVCSDCHSERDFTRFTGPELEGRKGVGAILPPDYGLPGRVVAPNLTPDRETGLGAWSDGEKIRAIRDGVSRDGQALFPFMPYTFYRHMSDADVEALVAYLNSLPAVRNPLPRTELKFPVGLFIKGVPRPAGLVPPPDGADRVKYGEYLTTLAGCIDCHTPLEGGRPVEEKRLAGGREFRAPGAVVVSANLTPHDSGIGPWGERQFLNKFAEYKEYAQNGAPKVRRESFTVMPWLRYSQLPEEDLGAIFTYLKTQPPVKNHVDSHPGVPKPDQAKPKS